MPKYLAKDELVRGNGLANLGLFSSILLGYAVGGYFIVQPGGQLTVGAVLVGSALIGWTASLFAPFGVPNAPDLKLSFNWPRLAWSMFALVGRARGVAAPLLGTGAFFFLTTAATASAPNASRANNGTVTVTAASLPKSRNGLGVSGAAVTAAGFLTIAIGVLTPMFAAGPAEEGVRLTVSALFSSPFGIGLAVAFIVSSWLMGLYISPLQAAIQRRAPREVSARIMAASAFANAVFAIPGSLSILAITRTDAPPTATFVWVGAGMLAIGALMAVRAVFASSSAPH